MNINTQQLRYFMELAKCLNFTRAAANLYVAQPTLSQQIAELEAQLGVSLFIRNSRSVTLTPAGKILYTAYPDILAQLKNVQQHMLVTAAGFSGSLTIGFLDVFIGFIPLIMRDFKKHFPDIAITPVCTTLNELNKGLRNTTIDVAFSLIYDLSDEEHAFFETKQIMRDTMCFVLPEGQPVPSDHSPTKTCPLIILDDSTTSGYYSYVKDCLKKLGVHVPKVISTNSFENLWTYLESGSGFTVLSEKYARFFSESTQFIPIPNKHLDFGALWSPSSTNPALPLFLDTLDQFLDPNAEQATPDSA